VPVVCLAGEEQGQDKTEEQCRAVILEPAHSAALSLPHYIHTPPHKTAFDQLWQPMHLP
jgi:hypothetical protein